MCVNKVVDTLTGGLIGGQLGGLFGGSNQPQVKAPLNNLFVKMLKRLMHQQQLTAINKYSHQCRAVSLTRFTPIQMVSVMKIYV